MIGKEVSFDTFLHSIQIKMTDIDLVNKVQYLFYDNSEFDLEYTFNLSFSEPQVISNTIYQNYLDTHCDIDSCLDIIDSISYSNLIHYNIFDKQYWDLYDTYTFYSCVLPSHIVKTNGNIIDRQVNPYKDVSYNFYNSYCEVKRIYEENITLFYKKIYNKLDDSNGLYKSDLFLDTHSCFYVSNMFIKCIQMINNFFNANKRGKNISKKEKLDICDNIIGKPEEIYLDYIVNIMYNYKLFEIDLDDVILKQTSYDDIRFLKENINKIDLRVFKRFINIFTMDDSQKLFKSCTDFSIIAFNASNFDDHF
jgi:hypothetical protein